MYKIHYVIPEQFSEEIPNEKMKKNELESHKEFPRIMELLEQTQRIFKIRIPEKIFKGFSKRT